MDRTEKRRLKDICNEDLFSLFNDYTKRVITRDMEEIYGKKASLLDSEKPWIFNMENK